MLNFFEKFLISLIQAAPAVLPLFVHSQHGIAIVNASEAVLGAALSKAATPSTTESAPVPSA